LIFIAKNSVQHKTLKTTLLLKRTQNSKRKGKVRVVKRVLSRPRQQIDDLGQLFLI